MEEIFLIVFGLLPSFVWLLFYLRKDSRPEPNKMVLKIFLWGILIAPLAAILELGLFKIGDGEKLAQSLALGALFYHIATAFIEEYLKYWVVKTKAIASKFFDEPSDAMLYMIISGLGFAAVENVLMAFGSIATGEVGFARIDGVIEGILLRFLGATFLHTLSSGLLGVFLAKALIEGNTKKNIAKGLIFSTALHFAFNFFIMLNSYATFWGLAILLPTAGFFILHSFSKLSRKKEKLHKFYFVKDY